MNLNITSTSTSTSNVLGSSGAYSHSSYLQALDKGIKVSVTGLVPVYKLVNSETYSSDVAWAQGFGFRDTHHGCETIMPARPVLMVLYTNDAVEVRYTDGSRLNILPCGSSFSYYIPQDAHPINGMKTVSQRCRFVTSNYRDMVLSAIDFRNRFAERPYLCEELIESEQIVALYARIKEIAWPKVVDRRNCEILQDGSVRITSRDEFGSLILSSHHRDFTVCYLSLLSQEKVKQRHHVKKKGPVKPGSQQTGHQSNTGTQSDQSDRSHDSPRPNENKDDLNISPITQASCTDSPQALSNASGSPVTPQDTVKDIEAKFRPFSTPTEEIELGPVCTPYGKTAVFKDYGNKHKVDKVRFQNDSPEHLKGNSKTKTHFNKGSSDSSTNQRKESNVSRSSNNDTLLKDSVSSKSLVRGDTAGTQQMNLSADSCSGQSGTGSTSSEGDNSSARCRYSWVTRHMSCDECPVNWSHVVRTAERVAEKGLPAESQDSSQKQEGSKSKPGDQAYLRKIKRDKCVFSEVPLPLPLTCVGQHLHKVQTKQAYDDGKNPVEDLSTFHHGRLKILLVDGVIYRIIRLPSMKVIEVYPGDGSVLVSQGPSAQFFQHIIPQDGKVEERTYSVKSAPPTQPTASYSVKSLLKRACRFLGHARQEEKTMPGSVGICCWKYEEVTLAEPVPSTLLEECVIPGYGKFSALSNGQVRIVFKDRTSLDMTCDFSKRINNCLEHSHDSSLQQTSIGPPSKTSGMCRLLLPNGQYQMVDIKQPGVYKRYIDMAKEWEDWVNSTPTQRELFYKSREPVNTHMSVERELQKINCFNYIVDNTVLRRDVDGCEGSDQGAIGASKPCHSSASKPGPSILRKTDHNSNYASEPVKSLGIRDSVRSKTNFQTIDERETRNTLYSGTHSAIQYPTSQNLKQLRSEKPLNQRCNPIGQSSGADLHLNFDKSRYPSSSSYQTVSSGVGGMSSLEGFHAVREALLRTSSVIKDIDHMLEKKS